MDEEKVSSQAKDIALWQELREVTAERQVLARRILRDIQAGSEVTRAIRRCPLPEGGYLPNRC